MHNITSKVTSLIEFSKDTYHEIFYVKADPRIRDRIFMGDPAPLLAIYFIYIVSIKFVLPKFMKNRSPCRLRGFENLLQFLLLLSSMYFLAVCSKFWLFHYNWRCEPLDTSNSPLAMLAVQSSHLYLMSKFVYIFESVLLGFRKNYSYMESYLLVHHTLYPLTIWSVVNYLPGGHAIFLGFINSFAHTVLFGYQLFANNFLLEKKLYRHTGVVSKFLLIFQCVFLFPHAIQLFFKNDCSFSLQYPITVLISAATSASIAIILVVKNCLESHKEKNIVEVNSKFLELNGVI